MNALSDNISPSEVTSFSLSSIGLTITITDFRNWLDVILIILSIVNIVIILIFKIRHYLKDKQLDDNEISDLIIEKEKLIEEINKLKDKIGDGKSERTKDNS